MRWFPVVTLAALAAANLSFAQAQDRAPRETVTAAVGGKKVAIEYGRPSLKGRTIEALLAQLPADRVWRAGVDQVTTLVTETEITLGGKKVPAGKYTLYVHAPEKGDWSLIVNSDPGIALSKIWAAAPPALADAPWPQPDYTKNIGAKEVARAALRREKSGSNSEMFTIKLNPAPYGADLQLAWGEELWMLEVHGAAK